MPTSSQCLILQKKIHNRPVSGRSSSCTFKEPAECHIASVYNLSGCMPMSGSTVPDSDAKLILGRESAQLFKYHPLPSGYTSILNVDRASSSLRWHALGGADSSDRPTAHRSEIKVTDRTSSSLSDIQKPRPNSAVPRPSSKLIVDPMAYDSLVNLGFRGSNLGLRDDCVIDSLSRRKGIAKKAFRTPKATEIYAPSKNSSTTTDSLNDSSQAPRNSTNSSEAGSEYDFDSESIDCGDDDSSTVPEELTRIKPSMYMRKDTPESRPRTAVFSFRDNEYSSHTEVKYLIEKQIGVKVKGVQFDPLDVRVIMPGVHSRWLVDFYSDWDLHVALKKGLVCGKDKLVFFKHDDIANREVSSFKYFKSIQDAKKKLKGKHSSHKKITGGKSCTKSSSS